MILALLTFVACDSSAEPAEAFVRLSGPVDPSIEATGVHTFGAIAWTWVINEKTGSALSPIPFEARFQSYALDIYGPPSPEIESAQQPDTTPALVWGLPVLIEADEDTPWQGVVDGDALLGWMAGHHDDLAPTIDWVPGREAKVVAFAEGFLFIGMDTRGATDLQDAAGWTVEGPYCTFDQVVAGLTLYEKAHNSCGGWRPLAAPGARTEFQGIPMVPWSPHFSRR